MRRRVEPFLIRAVGFADAVAQTVHFIESVAELHFLRAESLELPLRAHEQFSCHRLPGPKRLRYADVV